MGGGNTETALRLLLVVTVSSVAAGTMVGCLERRASDGAVSDDQACAGCHGDPSRVGGKLQKSAPARDLEGNTSSSSFPGIGSHAIHLSPSETHAPLACAECHVVPSETGDPGHADDARPAEIVFATATGTIASAGGRTPGYDVASRRCTDTYCHRGSDALWTKPRSSTEACGTCHGLPPPPPHVQVGLTECVLCHGSVVNAAMQITNPTLHVDGSVNLEPAACSACHGEGGPFEPTGAHAVHLAGGGSSRPVACEECHLVPQGLEDAHHADTPLPAEVVFSGTAISNDSDPVWDGSRCTNSWCHGLTSPEWTSQAGSLSCTGCHGQPPSWPHPQMPDCDRCHGAVVAADNTIAKASLHVNGTIDVELKTGCGDCHATLSGAHQSHVTPSIQVRPVPCSECHSVPDSWNAPGHIDSFLPAEISFSGVATAGNATPKYVNGKCEGTYCHGAATPEWTQVGGAQCNACHFASPPPGHMLWATQCNDCHGYFDGTYFSSAGTHVNGKLD